MGGGGGGGGDLVPAAAIAAGDAGRCPCVGPGEYDTRCGSWYAIAGGGEGSGGECGEYCWPCWWCCEPSPDPPPPPPPPPILADGYSNEETDPSDQVVIEGGACRESKLYEVKS